MPSIELEVHPMQHPHTIADVAILVSVPAHELREVAGRWASFAADYDAAAGRVSDAGRDRLLSEYTDDLLEFHPNYEPGKRLFQHRNP
jgi:hypothetical protein